MPISKRYRRSCAIVAPFAALLLTCDSYSQSGQSNQSAEPHQANSNQQPGATDTPALPRKGEETTEINWNKIECAKPRSHDEADLCEQRRMSQAAENSVWLNQIQVAIGAVGGFLLVLTLFYSREAAMAASKAAVAAQESADTMVDAERPHMLMSELQITGLANRPETDGNVILGVTYKFTNYGRSPALLKKVTVAISLVQDLPSQPEYQQEQALRFTTTVNGWYGLATPGDARVDGPRVRAVHSGEANIWVFGYLEYEDVFGKGHTNRFAYRLPLEVDSTVNFRPDGPDTYHEYT